MNVILIDSDCKGLFADEAAVKARVRDETCRVRPLAGDGLPQLEAGCRCVVVTALYSGVKQYHRELVMRSPQVRCWVFCVLGVAFKSERQQIAENLQSLLSPSAAPYCVVFDDAQTLAQTARLCRRPVKEKRCCLVASASAPVAQRCARALAPRLPDWDVTAAAETFEARYADADVILAAGACAADLALPAPQLGMGRLYAWLDADGPDDARAAYETLTGLGWNLPSAAAVYTSSLMLEEYELRLAQGQLTPAALVNDEQFVLFDAYGLPLRAQEYTETQIRAFLDCRCCFGKLAAQFR